MKILIAITYYRPHISGLTIYVERLARALAARGHGVTVLTSQYDRSLPARETQAGVDILRVPVAARLSKGVIMPTIGLVAWQLVPQHDVFSIHLPQFDAPGFALRGRLLGKPVVVTYHSDLLLPPSLLNWAAGLAVDFNNDVAARLADTLVAYTDDFARHSRLLSRYLDKVQVIPPPVELPVPTPEGVAEFQARHGLTGRGPVIGLAVRLAAEKGVEYLLQAMPAILERHPGAVILHAGPREAIGEADYRRRIEPLVAQLRDRYIYAGALEPPRMAEFFASCDVHVLPSINSTETFGLVQVEAALCGTPSVASALPGVRVPTQLTGMGLTVPPKDTRALADGLLTVLADRPRFVRPRDAIAAHFSPAVTAERYEALFTQLRRAKTSGR